MKLDDVATRAANELREAGEQARFTARSPAFTGRSVNAFTTIAVGAIAILAIGLPLWLLTQNGDSPAPLQPAEEPSDGVDGVLTIAGEDFPVGDLVDSFSEQLMYWPAPQPMPSFDTTAFGEHQPLHLLQPSVPDPDILNNPSIYLGNLGENSLFLTKGFHEEDSSLANETMRCLWIGGSFTLCADVGSVSGHPYEIGTIAAWIGVPNGTSVVALRSGNMPLGWQQTQSRVAVIQVPGTIAAVAAIGEHGLTFIALDASGQELLTVDLGQGRPTTAVTLPEDTSVTTTTSEPPVPQPTVIEPTTGRWVRTNPNLGGLLVDTRDLIWDGEAFYVLTRVGFGDVRIWRSADGLDWVEYPMFGPVGTLDGPRSLLAAGDRLIAGGHRDGIATVWVYETGSPWREIPLGPGVIRFLAEIDGRFIAFGTSAAPGPSGLTDPHHAVIWASEGDAGTWDQFAGPEVFGDDSTAAGLTTGPSGVIALSQSGPDLTTVAVAVSADGITWREAETNLPQMHILSLAEHDGGLAILSSRASVWRSTDGTEWAPTELHSIEGSIGTQGLALLGDRLLLAGGVNYVPPGSEYNATFPRVWLTDDGSSWMHLGPTDGVFAEEGIAYMVAASTDHVVMVGESGGPDEWAIFTFDPDD